MNDCLLQIIHISDTHYYTPPAGDPGPREHQKQLIQLPAKLRRISRLATGARHNIRGFVAQHKLFEGWQVHDREAINRFEALLQRLSRGDWAETPTWLVHTGDLTTWGDQASITAHLNWLQDLADASAHRKLFVLHGNHDYWPDAFPILARLGKIEKQVQWLRGSVFDEFHIENFHELPCGPNKKIVLLPLSSPIYERVRNTLALGRVENDVKYDTLLRRQHQLGRLHAILKQTHDNGESSVRIGLMHHPLNEGAYASKYDPSKRIINAQKLASDLDDKLTLLLSGHTHGTFPPTTRQVLTSTIQTLELVVGSMSQRASATAQELRNRNAECHQVQVVRLSHSDEEHLRMNRRIYRRRGNEGDYMPAPDLNLSVDLPFSPWP